LREISLVWWGCISSNLLYFSLLLVFEFYLDFPIFRNFYGFSSEILFYIAFGFALILFIASSLLLGKNHIQKINKPVKKIKIIFVRIALAETSIILGFFITLITGILIFFIAFIILSTINLVIIRQDNKELIDLLPDIYQ
jgi:hypothetical protein